VGAVLLALAVPRTIAAWEAIAAQPALEKIDAGKPLSTAELREAVAGLERSVTWVTSDRSLKDLGTLELSLYQALPFTDPGRGAVLASCERHFLEGLAANPADGMAWYRLAQVRQLSGGDARRVVVALMQSADMAPNYRPVFVGRTLGLLLYRAVLTPEEFQVAESQIRTFWRGAKPAERKALYGYVRGDAASLAMIENAVREDPDAKAAYEDAKAEGAPPAK